jgi:hypothetical protein
VSRAAGYALMGLVMNLFTQVVVGMYFYAVAGLAVAVLRSSEPAAPEDEPGPVAVPAGRHA